MFKFTQNLAKLSKIPKEEGRITVKYPNKLEVLNNISESLKYSSPEPSSINFLRSTPTKNIFFEFVSSFLSKPKITRAKTKKISSEVPSLIRSPIEIPKLQVINSPTPIKIGSLRSKNIHSKNLAFPNLKPSASLNTFLLKEKNRLESIHFERISLQKETATKEIKDESNKPRKKTGKKTLKSKKSRKKSRKIFKQT